MNDHLNYHDNYHMYNHQESRGMFLMANEVPNENFNSQQDNSFPNQMEIHQYLCTYNRLYNYNL